MRASAARLGVETGTASSAVAAALPALLGGIEANAQNPAGAASLSAALGTKDPALPADGVDLDQVDTDDGAEIVGNVFGVKQDKVVAALGSDWRTPDQSIIAKVLPMLAADQHAREGRRRPWCPLLRSRYRRVDHNYSQNLYD
jgi:hypothetical protein